MFSCFIELYFGTTCFDALYTLLKNIQTHISTQQVLYEVVQQQLVFPPYFRYLTGNPCTDYNGYREFVVGTLPQIDVLDGMEVTHYDKLVARQMLSTVKCNIIIQQNAYESQQRFKNNIYLILLQHSFNKNNVCYICVCVESKLEKNRSHKPLRIIEETSDTDGKHDNKSDEKQVCKYEIENQYQLTSLLLTLKPII